MINQTVDRQATQIFKTLLQAIENCSEESFRIGQPDRNRSIGDIAMHAAGTVQDLFGTESFAADWSTPVQSKAECIRFIMECRDRLMLPFILENDLASPDELPQYFLSKLDRVMKILRHLTQHTGEINLLLAQSGQNPGRFI